MGAEKSAQLINVGSKHRLLKSVRIDNYKNLQDFAVTFDGENFLDIFVGKNGTGKSNFFEAIVEIFNFVFSSAKKRSDIGFDFDLLYEIDGQDVHILRKDGQMEINGKTPLQAMKDWHKLKPELFNKQPYYRPGCDT